MTVLAPEGREDLVSVPPAVFFFFFSGCFKEDRDGDLLSYITRIPAILQVVPRLTKSGNTIVRPLAQFSLGDFGRFGRPTNHVRRRSYLCWMDLEETSFLRRQQNLPQSGSTCKFPVTRGRP